ncbi:hypothetical protein CANMA_005022 [Candida margitis]|uniref:uncharacterized protein n=1 Tax=Candida margitis TaxID=1775924 RepID=UPI002227E9C6|nr:uncharacterized protein CANMA_005022 [Candida margitis]KAI5952997.1 hypothetical protein CANMA_005022 [Candida margitis]
MTVSQAQPQAKSPSSSSSPLSLLPEDYLYYLDYLPDLQKCVNLFMTFTPLFSYGSTCISIYKRQTSLGFSIDICGTMFMASILRIFYYLCQPYEITLLHQSIVMIGIQIVLLKISLRFRPQNYDPELLAAFPRWDQEFENNLPRRLSSSNYIVQHKDYTSLGIINWVLMQLDNGILVSWSYFKTGFKQTLRLFDVYYKRPGLFWQWLDESAYWTFLTGFATVFGILTLVFHNNATYANTIGILGLFIESLLPIPQILMLNRIQSVKNFKIILLLSWLGGDCTKISYLVYGTDDVSVIFIAAGLFQMSLDVYIAFQYLTLKYGGDSWVKGANFLGSSSSGQRKSVDEIVDHLVLNASSSHGKYQKNEDGEEYEMNVFDSDFKSRPVKSSP